MVKMPKIFRFIKNIKIITLLLFQINCLYRFLIVSPLSFFVFSLSHSDVFVFKQILERIRLSPHSSPFVEDLPQTRVGPNHILLILETLIQIGCKRNQYDSMILIFLFSIALLLAVSITFFLPPSLPLCLSLPLSFSLPLSLTPSPSLSYSLSLSLLSSLSLSRKQEYEDAIRNPINLEIIAVRQKMGDYYRSKESMLADLDLMVSHVIQVKNEAKQSPPHSCPLPELSPQIHYFLLTFYPPHFSTSPFFFFFLTLLSDW